MACYCYDNHFATAERVREKPVIIFCGPFVNRRAPAETTHATRRANTHKRGRRGAISFLGHPAKRFALLPQLQRGSAVTGR